MQDNIELITIVAKVAGIGGIAIGAMLILFRDVVRRAIFPQLTKNQAYNLLKLMVILSWSISVIGIAAWVYTKNPIEKPEEDTDKQQAINASTDPDLIAANSVFYENEAEAYKLYSKSVNNSNPIAMGHLASGLSNGIGTAVDSKQAEYWGKKSAPALEQWCAKYHTPPACFSLALLYQDGIYVSKNKAKAFELASSAANEGYERAYTFVGSYLYEDDTINQNLLQAREWFKKAADKGNPLAMLYLAYLYQENETKDLEASIFWLKKSANLNYPSAQLELSAAYEAGEIIEKDLEESATLLKKAADGGDAEAMYKLGLSYYSGDNPNIPKNLQQARAWIEKAAIQGNIDAQSMFGHFNAEGIGGPKNLEQALKWIKTAAEQGDYVAQYNLGGFYAFGKGVPHDETQAFNWYSKSAEQGYDAAQFSLGVMYQGGMGTEKNIEKAIEWYKKSAEQGHAAAQFNLACLYNEAGDKANAKIWFEKSAEQDYAAALNNLGALYENGEGIPIDLNLANSYYRKALDIEPNDSYHISNYLFTKLQIATTPQLKSKTLKELVSSANSGNIQAQWRLAEVYTKGLGAPKDDKKAFSWMEQAANGGQKCAQTSIGNSLLNGIGTEKDIVAAIHWFEKALAAGDYDGAYNLGVIYLEGKQTKADKEKALAYLDQAAQAGHLPTLVYLSRIYRDGVYVKKDLIKSNHYLGTAAEKGSADALAVLESMTPGTVAACTSNL